MAHQETFRADVLEKHDQLELEKNSGVNRGTTTACIGLLYELTHKRQVQRSLKMPIEVIGRDKIFQAHIDQRGKAPFPHSHHDDHLSWCEPILTLEKGQDILVELLCPF
jgi:hypothetical protein